VNITELLFPSFSEARRRAAAQGASVPRVGEALLGAADVGVDFSPVGDLRGAWEASGQFKDNVKAGNYGQAAIDFANVPLNLAGLLIPGTVAGYARAADGVGSGAGRALRYVGGYAPAQGGGIRSLGINNADEYIAKINPTGARIPANMRPNLGMGDMYGMLPKGAKKVAETGDVSFFKKGDDFYAMAFNPDVGEMDVIGYAINRGKETELQVVQEMLGRGIGSDLSYLYRQNNPLALAGGLTDAGEKTARKVFKRAMMEGNQ